MLKFDIVGNQVVLRPTGNEFLATVETVYYQRASEKFPSYIRVERWKSADGLHERLIGIRECQLDDPPKEVMEVLPTDWIRDDIILWVAMQNQRDQERMGVQFV